MRAIALVLAFLGSTGHGRRVQPIQSDDATEKPNALKALGELLLTSDPEVGWQAAGVGQGVGHHSGLRTTSSRRQSLAPVAPTQDNARVSRAPLSDLSMEIDATDEGITDEKDGALRKLTLTSEGGASATIYTLGATVTSFQVPTEKEPSEVLFIRPDALLDGSKPISGGVPHCFPQFGPGDMQQHGFARNVEWKVIDSNGGPSPSVTLVLFPNDYTDDMWPKNFKNTYTISLSERNDLTLKLQVSNLGDEDFDFTTALHTYFAVGDIEQTQIKGEFKGSTIFDRMLDPPARITEENDIVKISKETDRVYEDVSGTVEIADEKNSRTIIVENTIGWGDTVVWSPFGNDAMGFRNFVCVESAKVKEPVVVRAGDTWEAVVRFSINDWTGMRGEDEAVMTEYVPEKPKDPPM